MERVNSFGKACSTNSQRAKVCHQIRASASGGSDKRVTSCNWVSAQIMLSPSLTEALLCQFASRNPFLSFIIRRLMHAYLPPNRSAFACSHCLQLERLSQPVTRDIAWRWRKRLGSAIPGAGSATAAGRPGGRRPVRSSHPIPADSACVPAFTALILPFRSSSGRKTPSSPTRAPVRSAGFSSGTCAPLPEDPIIATCSPVRGMR